MSDYENFMINKELGSYNKYRSGAASSCKVLRVRCTDADATIGRAEVAAAGDITLYYNNATTGTTVINAGASASNTVKEVVDLINAADGWEAVIEDALESDLVTTHTIAALTSVSAIGDAGVALYFTTAHTTNPYQGASISHAGLASEDKTDAGYINRLLKVQVKGDESSATGTATLNIYKVVAEASTNIWSQVMWAASATTDLQEYDFGDAGIDGGVGARLLVRVNHISGVKGGAFSVAVHGQSFKVEPL